MAIVVGWLALCFVIAWAAGQKGRSGVGFFFLSLFLSPLVGGFVLLIVPSRKSALPSPPPQLQQQPSVQTAATTTLDQKSGERTLRNLAVIAVALGISYWVLKPIASPTYVPAPSVAQPVTISTASSTRPVPATPSSVPNRPLTAGAETMEAQRWLFELGFDPGPRDGVSGPATVAAVKRYEAARKWAVTGDLDVRLLEYLRAEKGVSNSTPTQVPPPPSAPSANAARPVTEPRSEEVRVATRAIREADHPCPVVLAAQRLSDGSVRAACSNGEIYRVIMLRGDWLAMRCSAAERLGVSGC